MAQCAKLGRVRSQSDSTLGKKGGKEEVPATDVGGDQDPSDPREGAAPVLQWPKSDQEAARAQDDCEVQTHQPRLAEECVTGWFGLGHGRIT